MNICNEMVKAPTNNDKGQVTKICTNCIYFSSGWYGDDYLHSPLCCRPIQSLVYGTISLSASPLEERSCKVSGHCGEDAIYFEAIPQKASFWKRIFK